MLVRIVEEGIANLKAAVTRKEAGRRVVKSFENESHHNVLTRKEIVDMPL